MHLPSVPPLPAKSFGSIVARFALLSQSAFLLFASKKKMEKKKDFPPRFGQPQIEEMKHFNDLLPAFPFPPPFVQRFINKKKEFCLLPLKRFGQLLDRRAKSSTLINYSNYNFDLSWGMAQEVHKSAGQKATLSCS